MRAADAEEAAEKAAEEDDSNSAEYSILKHYDAQYVAWVKAAAGEKPKRFKVTGEAVPQYHAEEIPE